MERICIIALAFSAACSNESWLRLEVSLASGMPQPSSLRVTLTGSPVDVPLGGKALPGSLIVRHLDTSARHLQVDGLDGKGGLTSQGAADLALHSGENDATLTLGPPGSGGPDGGADLASADLAGADAALDLAGVDLAENRHCPVDKIFCDDFETGDVSRWQTSSSRPAGIASFSVDGTHAKGSFALDAQSTSNTTSTVAEVEQPVAVSSPALIAARFYTYAEANPGPFAIFYGQWGGASTTDGYAVGVDDTGTWVVTQDQAVNPDLHSSLAMTYNAFHCVELIVDYASNSLELDVDGAAVINATPTMLTVPTVIELGLVRGPPNSVSRVWLDDFAMALHRIGCE